MERAARQELRAQGANRQVLILVDDVVLTRAAEEQLCHLGIRRRHFNISVITCSVSYTTLPKRFRRSLDVLMVFSCPMSGDMQILTYEFAERSETARFALQRLESHECLVLETLTRRQQLFVWKARLWREKDLESDSEEGSGTQTSEPCAAEGSGSEASRDTLQILDLSVEQKRPEFPVVGYPGQLSPQNPAPRREGEVGADVGHLEVGLDVADQGSLAPDGRVPDARAQPLSVVEDAQQVHQLRL